MAEFIFPNGPRLRLKNLAGKKTPPVCVSRCRAEGGHVLPPISVPQVASEQMEQLENLQDRQTLLRGEGDQREGEVRRGKTRANRWDFEIGSRINICATLAAGLSVVQIGA